MRSGHSEIICGSSNYVGGYHKQNERQFKLPTSGTEPCNIPARTVAKIILSTSYERKKSPQN